MKKENNKKNISKITVWKTILSGVKKNWPVILVVLVAIFFRTYKVVERFEYAHDADLFSWIVRDILVNHHIRLIGQETSAFGIFIGPIFYYMLIPFFLLFKMDPIGALFPIIIISILTVLSYYWVFARLFNKTVGFISSFLYASLLSTVNFDLRVVPSTPTNIWLIWYLYVVVMLARGQTNFLPLLGILAALVWNIHIALAPALIASIIALFVGRKMPKMMEIAAGLVLFFVVSIPLFLFEMRHGFSQTLAFIYDLTVNHGGGSGLAKLKLVLIMASDNSSRLFFYPQGFLFNHLILWFGVLALGILLAKVKLLKVKELLVLYGWVFAVVAYFSLSSVIVSEYYLASIEVILILFVSLSLFAVFRISWVGGFMVIVLLGAILIKNTYFTITYKPFLHGYSERKAVTNFIVEDSRRYGFPCVAISYITSPGENVGFRYLFWLNNLHAMRPSMNLPVYTIVFPPELAEGAITKYFGAMGVIVPSQIPEQSKIVEGCSGQDSNVTDPMFGFTN